MVLGNIVEISWTPHMHLTMAPPVLTLAHTKMKFNGAEVKADNILYYDFLTFN